MKDKLLQLPPFKGVIPPEGGWRQKTYYLVELACFENNPIWQGIYYTGFLGGRDSGQPGAYSGMMLKPGQDSFDIYYMKALCELATEHICEIYPAGSTPCEAIGSACAASAGSAPNTTSTSTS